MSSNARSESRSLLKWCTTRHGLDAIAKSGVPGRCAIIFFIATAIAWPARAADKEELLRELQITTYTRAITPPDFSGRTADGREFELSSLRDKVVLVNFW